MKKYLTQNIFKTFLALVFIFVNVSTWGQTSSKEKQLVTDSKDGIKDFIHTDSLMKKLLTSSYGYVIFPNVGKGAIGVGGASGGGTVFEKGAIVGKAQMTQVTVGFQFGGQAYREVIFFQDKATLDKFKDNKIEFSAQVSAVAAKSGASANAKYTNGIVIFTQQKGGLMYEASVGGQKFKYTAYTK
ncbi:MAG TPA: YSC84-related protein [Puia sp.]|jgi:lipid-binding SYLF domain-containing protein|nr:YSC84-related protein [Puia sp.]